VGRGVAAEEKSSSEAATGKNVDVMCQLLAYRRLDVKPAAAIAA